MKTMLMQSHLLTKGRRFCSVVATMDCARFVCSRMPQQIALTRNTSRASFMSHLLTPPPRIAWPSPWLALWYGMVSHWLSSHFLGYSPRNSFSNLKQHYLAVLGLGALLSSPT